MSILNLLPLNLSLPQSLSLSLRMPLSPICTASPIFAPSRTGDYPKGVLSKGFERGGTSGGSGWANYESGSSLAETRSLSDLRMESYDYLFKYIIIGDIGDELPDKGVSVQPQVLSAFPSNRDGNSCVNSGIRNGGIRSFKSRSKSTLNWLPLDSQAVCCPVAVDEYLDKRSNFIGTAVRQHLQYLEWKMEFAIDKGKYRHRYLSPDGGEYEYSLF